MNLKDLSWIVAGLLPIVIVAACSSPNSPVLQPIPELNIDDMSSSIRDQFDAGIANLRADEDQPEANGKLGMLFDAYSRFEEAEVFYGRARFLDPDVFRWTYLHGQALAQLSDNEGAIGAL